MWIAGPQITWNYENKHARLDTAVFTHTVLSFPYLTNSSYQEHKWVILKGPWGWQIEVSKETSVLPKHCSLGIECQPGDQRLSQLITEGDWGQRAERRQCTNRSVGRWLAKVKPSPSVCLRPGLGAGQEAVLMAAQLDAFTRTQNVYLRWENFMVCGFNINRVD